MNKTIDYLIVGQGVAGSCFALKLLKENKTFVIIDGQKNCASRIAVGVYNPVVLKRFSLIWHAAIQLKWMKAYFQCFEELLGEPLITDMPTYRIFYDENEVKTWLKKSNRKDLQPYLNSKIVAQASNPLIHSKFGLGEVMQTGRINLKKCLEKFETYLLNNGNLIHDNFDFEQLTVTDSQVQYKDITANRIVFCEGYGIKSNPYFNYLPIIGVKGEVLKITTETALPNGIWKGKNFLLPIEGNLNYTASTYNREDLTYLPTEQGKNEMLAMLEEIYLGKYQVIEHTAGIRPTVIDRRPIVGSHPKYANLYVFNGMGTRGTLLAPQMSEFLYDQIEKNIEIEMDANVRRFDGLYAFQQG